MHTNFRSTPIRSSVLLMAGLLPATLCAETIQLNGRQFTIPDGFALELAAGPPLTSRPITADFDELGRLYVAESSGSNENVRVQLEKKPHSILRLVDVDGDGTFDKRTVFADRMMFPEGTLWFDGSLYVTAPPQIWKLTDTDDDGVADKREVWFDGKTLNGCANDLHGPYLGPDGWIYWCKGAFEEQTYERPGRKPLVTRAAHIFRRRPEGGPIEAVMTGGMDNPVDVAFSRGGERFFTTTFLQHPRDGLRDGIIHAVYGGVYGKDHGVLAGHPRTGELMPPLVHLGAAAPCGLTHLQSRQLGDDNFDDSLLACQFNKHKVSRHVLTRQGGTFTTRDEEFLSSPDLDFHPTDVIEDADGSVLVVDTGGWYKLCCPTSQLYKPDIPGAIYRLRRKEASPVADPRGNNLDWSKLSPTGIAKLVSDRRHAVRERAKQALARLDNPPFDFLAERLEDGTESDRLHNAWAIVRIDHPRARALTRAALNDTNQEIRSAAIHGTAIWKDAAAQPRLHELLAEGTAADVRVAAEAIGRIGSRESVRPLLHAARRAADRAVEHALIYALLEIGNVEATASGLLSSHPRELQTALVVIDQMEGGSVDGKRVVGLLDTKLNGDDELERTCWWLIERHPEWGDLIAPWFSQQLSRNNSAVADPQFVRRLALFTQNQSVQNAMANALQQSNKSVRLSVLKAMADGRVSPVPDVWAKQIAAQLEDGDEQILAQAVATVRSLATAGLGISVINRVMAVASREDQSSRLRLQALSTVVIARKQTNQKRSALSADVVTFVCRSLSLDQPANDRALAVDVLAGSELNPDQLSHVAEALKSTGPMELKQLIPLFEQTLNDVTGRLLVAALTDAPAATSLDPQQIHERLAKFGNKTSTLAKPLIERIREENSTRLARIESALAKMDTADERRGQKVFHATKTSCIVCHQMGYLGGNIGPSLNRIGNIRSERDLLESILFPSASFVRSYEPISIIMTNGQVVNGVIRDETPDEVVLAIDAQKIIRIPHNGIEERHPGKVSIMPAGLDKVLSDQDLADMVRFLKVSR